MPLCIIGGIIAVSPLMLLGIPDGGGPVGFAAVVIQATTLVIGAGIAGIGYYSYKREDIRLAVGTYLAVLFISVSAVVGAQIEMSGGPLIPIWIWALTVVVSVVASIILSRNINYS